MSVGVGLRGVLGSLLVVAGCLAGPAAVAEASTPNVVVVMTDDQTAESLRARVMPRTTRALVERGTRFDDAIVTTPQCCPSRASFLTGQYAHNNGVLSNGAGYRALRAKRNVLPAWLRRAGYRTAHLGKFLNGYEETVARETAVAPGWDQWRALVKPDRYYRYDLSVNGRRVSYGDRPRDYLSDVLTRRATRLVRRWHRTGGPFFISLAYFAPHQQIKDTSGPCERAAIPGPGDLRGFRDAPLPRPPSFNEPDVSDKPSFIRALPPLDAAAIGEIERRHRCRLASLQAVDRGVGRLVRTLRRTGELRNTAIVFTSDNGYYHGEHRIAQSKVLPYEEAIEAPLAIRLPRTSAGDTGRRRVGDPVANIDLAPTILRLADARPCLGPGRCRTLDGRSLLPLIRGKARPGRAIVVEYRDTSQGGFFGSLAPCAYRALRTSSALYAEYVSEVDAESGACEPADEREHYDLLDDPFQLVNRYPALPATGNAADQAALAARLDSLRRCAGIAGRDPAPPAGSHCE